VDVKNVPELAKVARYLFKATELHGNLSFPPQKKCLKTKRPAANGAFLEAIAGD
jgi:hypothetical protein